MRQADKSDHKKGGGGKGGYQRGIMSSVIYEFTLLRVIGDFYGIVLYRL